MNKTWKYLPIITVVLAMLFIIFAQSCPVNAASIKTEKKVFKEKGDQYSIKAEYPRLVNYKNKKSQEKFNAGIKKYIDNQAKGFKEDYKKAKASTPKLRLPWNLDIAYEIKYQKNDIICVIMRGGEFTGGAHPNPLFYTLTFDLKSGEKVELKDLFKPKSKYLARISKYCIAQLIKTKHTDEKWIRDGAKAEAKNYKCFILTDKGILILFPPYQVDCYAAGVRKVLVPYKKLNEILDPKGPVGRILKK
ncbi:MAG: DUF3298 and DUF4163 domain-containing protein [Candidatus Eremiobacteraeota bacterium]|nr:DUF3298 and DUF4163 domain-containing protein [Candidatus Eremiobacteraeota bacterium]